MEYHTNRKPHAQAWKNMFDDFLQKREKNFKPIGTINDYKQYIDGIPRFDGIRSFLKSRDIVLPQVIQEIKRMKILQKYYNMDAERKLLWI